MVLEFMPGETLKERLNRYMDNRQLMTLTEVIVITQQICTAVAFAHKNGVIHRDIKPSKVIISTQGEAIPTDFRIAKMVGIEEFTATGAVIDTADFTINLDQYACWLPDRAAISNMFDNFETAQIWRMKLDGSNPQSLISQVAANRSHA